MLEIQWTKVYTSGTQTFFYVRAQFAIKIEPMRQNFTSIKYL